MTTDEEAWEAEEAFWTGGADRHAEALDPECVMAFPAPAGIVAGVTALVALGLLIPMQQARRRSNLDDPAHHP